MSEPSIRPAQSVKLPFESPMLRPSHALVVARPRLDFIDGVRGLAALFVLLYHCANISQYPRFPGYIWNASIFELVMWPTRFGEDMVIIFIIISSFSLSWSEDGRRARGDSTKYGEFMARRLIRIAPTYYLAFAFGLLVFLLIPSETLALNPPLAQMRQITGMGIFSHVAMFHNFSPDWFQQANGPLWTVAVELQLYLLFPLLYAALRIKAGLAWASLISISAAAVATGIASLGSDVPGRQLPAWFVLGAFLARTWRDIPIPPRISLIAGTSLIVLGIVDLPQTHPEIISGPIWACGASLLLLYRLQHPSRATVLSSRPLRALGGWSYALYAVHMPVVALCWLGISRTKLSTQPASPVAMIAVAVPVALALAALVNRVVDTRAVRSSRRFRRRTAVHSA